MRSNTSIGKQTRAYFVALEAVLFAYTEASRIWEGRSKDRTIQAKDNEIQDYIKQLKDSRVPFSSKEPLQTLYVCASKSLAEQHLVRIGRTKYNTF